MQLARAGGFGEGLLDRVAIGAIGRQAEKFCASRLDYGVYPGRLVAAQIVKHNDVAARQCRVQHVNRHANGTPHRRRKRTPLRDRKQAYPGRSYGFDDSAQCCEIVRQ